MKNLIFILSMLLSSQVFASYTMPNDTIKIIVNGNVISIEVDDAKEIEEILKHDLNQLFKNLKIDVKNDSVDTEIKIEMFMQGDSMVHKVENKLLILEEELQTDDDRMVIIEKEIDEDGVQTKKVIKISNEGIFIKEKEQDKAIFEMSNDGIFHTSRRHHEEHEEDHSPKRTFGITEFHFGLNNYTNADDKVVSGENHSLKSLNSVSLGLHFYAKTRVFNRGPLFLKYGIGFSNNHYKYSNDVYLAENANGVTIEASDLDIKKSKLATLFVDAPLMLQLDFSKNKKEEGGFNVAVGPFVGYMLKGKSKYVYIDENNNSNTEKLKGDFYVNKIRYGVQGQLGVLGLNFYGKYHLSSLFEESKGPEELNVFDFGIVFDL